MKLLDVVELAADLPEEGLAEGAIGTVVDVRTNPPGYEVEFVGDDGRTLALTALRPDRVRTAVPAR